MQGDFASEDSENFSRQRSLCAQTADEWRSKRVQEFSGMACTFQGKDHRFSFLHSQGGIGKTGDSD